VNISKINYTTQSRDGFNPPNTQRPIFRKQSKMESFITMGSNCGGYE